MSTKVYKDADILTYSSHLESSILDVSLVSGKPGDHPRIFSSKELLKIVTLQILNFISVS